MSDLDKKRNFVEALYPGPRWKKRVRAMPDGQVMAIYMREINKAKDPKKPSEPEKKESDSDDDIPF